MRHSGEAQDSVAVPRDAACAAIVDGPCRGWVDRPAIVDHHGPVVGRARRVRMRNTPGIQDSQEGTRDGLPHALPGRVTVDQVRPEIDAGRYPAKRVVGDDMAVGARIVTDGYDRLAAVLRYRRRGEVEWCEVPMVALPNDQWEATFPISELGAYEYTVEAWIDAFASWRDGLAKKVEARLDVGSELLEGAALVEAAARRARGADAAWLRARAAALTSGAPAQRTAAALDPALAEGIRRHPDRRRAARYPRVLLVTVDRERARYGAWYEMFPRSCAGEPDRHGTLRDCAARLEYVAAMGFDVVYLPPIHPIGAAHRKGRNNTPAAEPGDPGSPWAIGGAAGGFTAVHPELGTLEDFDQLVERARQLGLEIALDLALQCAPDHPYVREHPEWFRHRPDGTIQYAENPPKKYQDIYPIDFECEDWRALWAELRSVVLFWVEHGVRIFRVDNPHTKPFAFWEWLIAEVRARHPDVFFLAEAFTRPAVMHALAKGGFAQSYSYFTWRNTKAELTEYLTELTHSDVREYMRPNLFTNTPDILHEFLQFGGRPAFQIRLLLAATLGASYGIYGPPFELCVGSAIPGTEEYADSEKYQVRHWDLQAPGNLCELIALVNRIRRENPALQQDWSLRFLDTDNDAIIAYAKHQGDDVVITVVNLDPRNAQSAWVRVPLGPLGLEPAQPYQAHELLSGAHYLWHGEHNYVALDPQMIPAHILRIRRRVRTERDFDYFF
jgi:starch synthase (maltosyl-transferring)